MNVIIEGKLDKWLVKAKKNKKTGEVIEEILVKVEQDIILHDGQPWSETYNIPVDISMKKYFADKKQNELVRVPCNIYGENFAEIKISKAK